MKKTLSIIFAVFFTALTLCSCGTDINKEDGLSIVCTAFPQYDFAKNILGTEEGLTLLLDDGADLHSYEPTAQDIIRIGSADIFIYGGGVSDDWVDGVLESANNPALTVIATMDLVDTLKEVGAEDAVVIMRGGIGVVRGKIRCDYFDYLAGDESGLNAYRGEYMQQYSWAEVTHGSLESMENHDG